MSDRIDQICETLRAKLTKIDGQLSELKAKLKSEESGQAEHDARAHAETLEKRIAQTPEKLASAQVEAKTWREKRRAATRERIAEWKERQETEKLENRAAEAESYAEAAIETVATALDEAEHAALEAVLARNDADQARA